MKMSSRPKHLVTKSIAYNFMYLAFYCIEEY